MFQDRTIIVSGAASPAGLGFASARFMAERGARIAILDLDGEASAAAARKIGPDHIGVACDVTDIRACAAAAAEVTDRLGVVDGLLTCAGVTRSTPILEIERDEYQHVMDVNVGGTMYLCQAVIPGMIERGRGAIVTVSSVAAQRGGGLFGSAHYSGSKGAVLSMTKALARELAPHGVRVNAVAPGMVETGIFGGALTEEHKRDAIAAVPLGRLGRPEDVAAACGFLMSDWSAYMTGVTLDVNGGLHIH